MFGINNDLFAHLPTGLNELANVYVGMRGTWLNVTQARLNNPAFIEIERRITALGGDLEKIWKNSVPCQYPNIPDQGNPYGYKKPAG